MVRPAEGKLADRELRGGDGRTGHRGPLEILNGAENYVKKKNNTIKSPKYILSRTAKGRQPAAGRAARCIE